MLDNALLGLLRGGLQFWRNGIFAGAKVALLAFVVLLAPNQPGEFVIYACWAAGNLLSFFWLARAARVKMRVKIKAPAGLDVLRGFGGRTIAHHLLNIVTTVPSLLLPVLVTAILSARVAGAFYAAWMLVGFAFLLPAAFTRVLFTVGTEDPAGLAQRIRFTLGVSALSGIGAAIGYGLLSNFALQIFGDDYAEVASRGLQILGCAALPQGIKHHFIAVERLRGQTVPASLFLSLGAVLEIAAAGLGAEFAGLTGLCGGWVLGSYLEAGFMLPVIHSAANPARGR
jgi:O-antigen/teichoic acid export membrane protein